MYIPRHFEELEVSVLHELIQERPFATVIILSVNGFEANHIPFQLKTDVGQYGILQGHIARGDPIVNSANWKTKEVLVIFQGANMYISPSLYATKKTDGKVVPTWNYIAVHAHGTMEIIDDPTWLYCHLQELTEQREKELAVPWKITDAPEDFIKRKMTGIIGIEIVISRLTGKWKLSQNQPVENQHSLIQNLSASSQINHQEMAKLIAQACDKKGRG